MAAAGVAVALAAALLACAPRSAPRNTLTARRVGPCSAGASGASSLRFGDLAWMTGTWVDARGDQRSEEIWSHDLGHSLLGMNRLILGGRTVFFEFLRIERRPDGVFYVAQPKGGAATPFRRVETGHLRAVFENPAHDFPRRLTYWRTPDDRLHARAEGVEGGKAITKSWTWRLVDAPRSGNGGACPRDERP